MQRRQFLQAVAGGTTLGSAGCLGIGGDLVVTVQKDVSVEPGTGWIKEIPDVSDSGGEIAYTARSRAPFDVYFFTSAEAMRRYDAYTSGEEPESTPPGDQDVGRTATSTGGDRYEATSANDGGRQPIEGSGPYYFVLDHTDYPAAGGARPDEMPERRSIFLDLTVTRQRFGL
ncbi:hypothetical protein [Halorientalis halophila]|uniref:hypothetical protein n=1 Tax=Halorientalis halophila TaxID=3108499 RepID=UPI00300883EB